MRTLFFILAGSLCIYAQIFGQKIYLPNDSFDFGTIKQGEIVKHTFQIVNKGDDTLKISSVITSCGCTAFDLQKKEVLQGESINLKVEFNSMDKVGAQTKYISIASNDKENPQTRLTMKGTVLEEMAPKAEIVGPKIEFAETEHNFGSAKEGTILEYQFSFKNIGTSGLEIKNIQTSCGCTAAMASSKLLKPGEKGTIKIKFDTANRSGHTTRTITITTNERADGVKVLTIAADIQKKEG